jgi:HTH-type transcriptional regulator, sugar sensing transcriptional regulator
LSENLIDKLKELGFNTYEAKVYLALLQHHPATGYEISKDSGVPQARAYDTLKALESSNVVVAIGGKPTTYMPIRPDELLDRWETSFKGSLGYLRNALPNLADETIEPVINMRGEASIFKRAIDMIQNAKQSVFVELWQVDALRLAQPLQQAKARGVDVKVVGYDDCFIDGVEVYQHSAIEHSVMSGRWLILAVDSQEGLVSTVGTNDRPPQAVVTRNPGIVLVIKELVVHNIFLLEVERNLLPEIERLYGRNMLMLRRRILGAEMSMSTC